MYVHPGNSQGLKAASKSPPQRFISKININRKMQQKTNKQRNITIINSHSGKVEPNDKCNILCIPLPIMQDIIMQ